MYRTKCDKCDNMVTKEENEEEKKHFSGLKNDD